MKFPSLLICFPIAFEFLSVFFVLFPICVVFLLYCRMIFLSLRGSYYAEKSLSFSAHFSIYQTVFIRGQLINVISCSEVIFFFAHFPFISIFLLYIFFIFFFKFHWLSVLVIYYYYHK